MPSESRKNPPFRHREKGRFQCRKLVQRKCRQSDCQNTQAQTKRIGRPLPTLPMPSRRAGRLWLLRHRQSGRIYQYETSSDLRDSESIPLKQNIHDYFKAEVQPHISEAWLNMESVKSAMKSASTNTSTATNHYAALQKLPKIFWRWKNRLTA